MDRRTRLAVSPLEDRWVPATPTTGTGAHGRPDRGRRYGGGHDGRHAHRPHLPGRPRGEAGRHPGVGGHRSATGSASAGTSVTVYDAAYTGGVWSARADVTGDGIADVTGDGGIADVVSAPGAGLAPTVKVVSGADGTVARSFDAYESDFTGGVVLAAVDLNGDGRADLVTGTDQGGGPRVRVFDGLTNRLLADFFGIDDAAFRGGVRVAAGDVNGDGVPDIVAAAGYGGGPRVAVWDGKSLLAGVQKRVCADFFAFEPTLRNGVYPAVGAYNADKYADLLLGAGPGGGPRVIAVSGKALASGADPAAAVAAPLFDFFAGLADDRGGVRVGAVPGTTSTSTTAVVNDVLTVGGSGAIGYLYTGSTRKGVQTVDREFALAAGLLADATGQKLFTGTAATTTGSTSTTGSGTTGTSTTTTGTPLQTLLGQFGG